MSILIFAELLIKLSKFLSQIKNFFKKEINITWSVQIRSFFSGPYFYLYSAWIRRINE